jgi:hypothetical protein
MLVLLGHQGLYVAFGLTWAVVGRIWRGERRSRDSSDAHRLDGYQVAEMSCLLVLLDNLLRRIGGAGELEWWWLALGKNGGFRVANPDPGLSVTVLVGDCPSG